MDESRRANANERQGETKVSYTPEDQYLEPSLEKILEGIKEFNEAAQKRTEAGRSEWKQSHLDELRDLRIKFIMLEAELTKLKDEVR